jgi:hypothetical protein
LSAALLFKKSAAPARQRRSWGNPRNASFKQMAIGAESQIPLARRPSTRGRTGRYSAAAASSCMHHCCQFGTVLAAVLKSAEAQLAVKDLNLSLQTLKNSKKSPCRKALCGQRMIVWSATLSKTAKLEGRGTSCATYEVTGTTLALYV